MSTDAQGPTDAVNDDDTIGQETQQDDEQTQAVDQPSQREPDDKLWGVLIPCNANCNRINFDRRQLVYKVGRNRDLGNHIIFPGFKVSNEHCVIKWDGLSGPDAAVTVTDTSSNGTFISNEKIGKGNSRIMRDGSELAFGSVAPQSPDSVEDYRFIFRFFADGQPKHGLYAHYDLLHELGKGAFATVMKVFNRTNATFYACKFIHTKTVGSKEDEEKREIQLDREINIMAGLSHPNICRFREMFTMPDHSRQLVLELVTGGDLLDYIIKNNGVDEDMGKHFTYQMCDALSYCHAQQIAHRDLKPENILLTSDTIPQIKIADFGLAKVADSATMLRTMCGTPSYLAPEVVAQIDSSGYGNNVDSWSLGVIVYSMLANSAPFIDDDTLDIRTKILDRTVNWEHIRSLDLSNNSLSFVRRLLDFSPKTRMTCHMALFHPWLLSYEPLYKYDDVPGYRPSNNTDKVQVQADMDVEEDMPASQGGTPASSGLKRRSEVLHRAMDDNNGAAPEIDIPADMLANFEMSSQARMGDAPPPPSPPPSPLDGETDIIADAEAPPILNGNSNGNGNGLGHGHGMGHGHGVKRSLSPMSEDPTSNPDEDAMMDVTSPKKKARSSHADLGMALDPDGGEGEGMDEGEGGGMEEMTAVVVKPKRGAGGKRNVKAPKSANKGPVRRSGRNVGRN